jgi:hypothetical protein
LKISIDVEIITELLLQILLENENKIIDSNNIELNININNRLLLYLINDSREHIKLKYNLNFNKITDFIAFNNNNSNNNNENFDEIKLSIYRSFQTFQKINNFSIANNAILINKADPESITNAVETLIENPVLQRFVGCNARLTVENYFNVDRQMKQYSNLYQTVLNT